MNGGNIITNWRQAVQTYLAGEFPGAEVTGGRREGLSRDKDRITVFWPGWPTLQRDLALANPTLTVRYWPATPKQPATETPRDPGPLEAAAVALMVAFHDKRKTGDFVNDLACYVAGVVSDEDEFKIDLTLQAVALNPAVSGA